MDFDEIEKALRSMFGKRWIGGAKIHLLFNFE
jgi:hypothetical protein